MAQIPPDAVALPHTGRSHVEARPAAVATVAQQPAQATPSRPPLPRRRRQTHMAPQLQLGPSHTSAEPAGEHQPGLMASFMSGVSQGEADPPRPDSHG